MGRVLVGGLLIVMGCSSSGEPAVDETTTLSVAESAEVGDADTVFGLVLEEAIAGLGLDEREAACFRDQFAGLAAGPGPLDPEGDARAVLDAIAAAESECLSVDRRDEIVASAGGETPSTAELDAFLSAVGVVSDDLTTEPSQLMAAGQEACLAVAALGRPVDEVAVAMAEDTALADRLSAELAVDLGTVLGPAELIAFVTLSVPAFCPELGS